MWLTLKSRNICCSYTSAFQPVGREAFRDVEILWFN